MCYDVPMSTRLHIVMPDGLLARIDAALGPGQPRADFIRRAVEQALGEPIGSTHGGDDGQGRGEPRDGRGAEARTVVSPATVPAPAERHRRQPGPNVENIRSSSQSKRDVSPRPKGGK